MAIWCSGSAEPEILAMGSCVDMVESLSDASGLDQWKIRIRDIYGMRQRAAVGHFRTSRRRSVSVCSWAVDQNVEET